MNAATINPRTHKPCPSCGEAMNRQSVECRACWKASAVTARPMELRCAHCKEWLPDDAFNRTRSAHKPRRGRHIYCRECARERYDHEYYRALRERNMKDPAFKARHAAGVERARLKRRYGITPEEYNALLASQDFGCAICSATCNPDGSKLCVDHDHSTGDVRGLLCRTCNALVGLLGDSADKIHARFEGVRVYLEGE